MLLSTRALEFLRDESGGERDTLTTLLILGLIIIPLLMVIIFFGNDILKYAKEKWAAVKGAPVIP